MNVKKRNQLWTDRYSGAQPPQTPRRVHNLQPLICKPAPRRKPSLLVESKLLAGNLTNVTTDDGQRTPDLEVAVAVGLASFTRCRPRWWRSRWAVAGSNSGWVNKQRQKANQPSQTHAGSMIFFPSTIASFGDSLCRQVGFWKNSHSGRDQRSPPPP